jgi:hypothetical protein
LADQDRILDDASQTLSAGQSAASRPLPTSQTLAPKAGEAAEESYIGRLQAAKKRAMKDRE